MAIKILDSSGSGNSADVLAGIQWLIDNRERYNIRIANLSVGTPDNSGKDPLVRAVNAAWDSGIVMTIAAGNNGPEPCTITSPGISRKVITVGASDDNKIVKIWDNTLENFSGRGPTSECIMKPDVIAPGANIISCLTGSDLPRQDNDDGSAKIVSDCYLEMSGTSMSTPIVSGAIALLLEKNPTLMPNEVKYLLKHSTQSLNYPQNQQGWGLINIEKLVLREVNHVK